MEYKIQSKLLKHLSKVMSFVDSNEASPFEEDEDEEVTFDLVYGSNGNIAIIARDQNGKKLSHGSIVSLTSDGKLKRYKHLNPKIGLKLNSTGQVALEKSE